MLETYAVPFCCDVDASNFVSSYLRHHPFSHANDGEPFERKKLKRIKTRRREATFLTR